jgi:pimeloyl-ACP methyl ester carboxylesterase
MIKSIITTGFTVLLFAGCKPSDQQSNNTSSRMTSNAQQDTIGHYASVNGLNMYYEIHGTGTPLVLIHGGGSTLQTTFGRVIPSFSKNHQVIAVEMQAHGHTADIDRPLSFEQDADDVAELLKQLNIPKADIFGFSNGASTTLQLAIRHPELVNKIIVAAAFYKKSGAQPWFFDMMANATFEQMPQPYKDAFLKINPDTNAIHRMYERDVARMQSFPDISEELMKTIKAPAFIITSDQDVVTPEHAVEMHRLLPKSQLAIFPGGHGEFLGELTIPFDSVVVAGTVAMVERFLKEVK